MLLVGGFNFDVLVLGDGVMVCHPYENSRHLAPKNPEKNAGLASIWKTRVPCTGTVISSHASSNSQIVDDRFMREVLSESHLRNEKALADPTR